MFYLMSRDIYLWKILILKMNSLAGDDFNGSVILGTTGAGGGVTSLTGGTLSYAGGGGGTVSL
jgi:hypothetical protein